MVYNNLTLIQEHGVKLGTGSKETGTLKEYRERLAGLYEEYYDRIALMSVCVSAIRPRRKISPWKSS
jgi:hypothetical protein